MASLYTPDRDTDAAVSKQTILVKQRKFFYLAHQCIPILWKLLVLPAISAKLERNQSVQPNCTLASLDKALASVVDEKALRTNIIRLLRRYDYLRLDGNETIRAGTRLWTDVDALKMIKALGIEDDFFK